jgi:hypothetical protein
MISGFRRNFDEVCALVEHYTALCGNCVPMFQDNVSVPSSRVKMGPNHCPKTSVHNYHTTPHNIPEECRSQVS